MNKLASINYDITDHMVSGNGEKIASFADNLSKEAKAFSLPDFEELQERPDKDFALVTYHPGQGEMKKFARYNKEITEINLNLLEKEADSLPDEIVKKAAHNLVQAADDFGLDYEGELRKYAEEQGGYTDPSINLTDVDEFAYQQKIASVEPIQKWAMPSLAKYPLETSRQIEEACNYFEKHANEFDPVDALEFAVNVKKAAEAKEGVHPSDKIEKFASIDPSMFNEDLPTHIDVRKSYLTPEQDDEYSLYDEFTKKASELKPSKAAQLLERIDKEAELDRAWGKGLENPMLAVFGKKFTKKASAGPSLAELQALDNAELTAIVGNSTIKELKSDEGVAVYNSLPTPIKREIDKLLG